MKIKKMATKAFNFKSSPLVCLGLAALFVTSQPVLAEEVLSDNWKYDGNVYFWGAEIGGTTTTDADIDLDLNSILDNLNFVLMGGVGAKKGKLGLNADVIYMDLEDRSNKALSPLLTLDDVKMKSWIVTPTVSYNVVNSEQASVDLLAGVRYLYLKSGITIDPLVKTSKSGTAWDGIVGAKGQIKLNEKWYVPFYLDVGTGDTDLTWQGFTGVGYKYKNFDLNVGYRYLDWDFDDNDKGASTFNDLNISGPIIGAKFDF